MAKKSFMTLPAWLTGKKKTSPTTTKPSASISIYDAEDAIKKQKKDRKKLLDEMGN